MAKIYVQSNYSKKKSCMQFLSKKKKVRPTFMVGCLVRHSVRHMLMVSHISPPTGKFCVSRSCSISDGECSVQ